MKVLICQGETEYKDFLSQGSRENSYAMLKNLCFKVILLFLLLLNYGSYWMFLNKISKEITFVIPFILSAGIFFVFVLKNKKISLRRFLVVLLLSANVLLSCIFNNDFSTDNFLLIISIFTAFFLVTSVNNNKIIKNYVQIIVFLSVYSLIATYIILPLCLNGIIKFIPIYTNANRPYYDMGLTMCLGYYGVPRNNGFCREPGVFQVYLVLAEFFLIEKFTKSKKNIVYSLIIAVTLLTTFSAVAYVCLVIIGVLILKKYSKDTKHSLKYCLSIIICVAIIFCVVWSNQSTRDELYRTFSKWLSLDSGSMKVRSAGIFLNLSLFFEKPIFGYGLVNSWFEIIKRSGLQDVTGTPLIAFAGCGIFFGTITNIFLLRFCRTNSKLDTFLCWLAIFISLSSQNLILSFIFWITLLLKVPTRKEIFVEK